MTKQEQDLLKAAKNILKIIYKVPDNIWYEAQDRTEVMGCSNDALKKAIQNCEQEAIKIILD